MTQTTLMQARDLVHTLSTQEKLSLLQELTAQLVEQWALEHDAWQKAPLPVIHAPIWPEDVPLHRKDLYNDQGR